MTGPELAALRITRLKLTQVDLAEQLGIGIDTLIDYEAREIVPRVVELACRYLVAHPRR